MKNVVAIVVLSAFSGFQFGAVAPPDPVGSVTVSEPRQGIRFELTGMSTAATLSLSRNDGAARLDRMFTVTGAISSERTTAFFAPFVSITELTDDRGTDLLAGTDTQTPVREVPRREVVAYLKQSVLSQADSKSDRVHGNIRGLSRVPERVRSLRGHVQAYVASEVLRAKVKPELMAEPIEPAPGVTFLVSDWTPKKESTTLGFELHIRRNGADELLDPIFAGVRLIDRQGRALQTIERVEEVKTRDEYICVVNDWALPPSYTENLAAIELVVITKIELEKFEFHAEGLLLGGVE